MTLRCFSADSLLETAVWELRCYVAYLEQETIVLLKGVKARVGRYTEVRNPGELFSEIHIVNLWQNWMLTLNLRSPSLLPHVFDRTTFPLLCWRRKDNVRNTGSWWPTDAVEYNVCTQSQGMRHVENLWDGCLKNCCCFFSHPGILEKWSTVN